MGRSPISGPIRRKGKEGRRTLASPLLFASLVGILVLIPSLVYVDAAREEQAVIDAFVADQATLAAVLAKGIAARVSLLEQRARRAGTAEHAPETPFHLRNRGAPKGDDEEVVVPIEGVELVARRDALIHALTRELASVDRATSRVLVAIPGQIGLLTISGEVERSAPLEAAIAKGASTTLLDKPQAFELGLPMRVAGAGIGHFEDAGGHWALVVVTTAERLRDHEARMRNRTVLVFAIAIVFTVTFGGFVLRERRREDALLRELAVQEARRDADERLARADKLATLGAIATGIAHELSTPLNVISGRTQQALSRGVADDKSRAALTIVLDEVDRSLAIIRGFLGLARGESPKLVSVDSHDLARSCFHLTEHRFQQAGVHLELEASRPVPRVACDRRLLEQALINLLLNACDACEPRGAVRLRVTEKDQRVAFEVDNDGATIPLAAAARATEPFFTTKPPEKGTGLGLAIANEIVKHHHGTLTIGPRPAARGERISGTRACIEIPAEPDEATDA